MSTLQYVQEYIIIYGLKNKMQAIRIFYLVGSAQCKHETYAITYIHGFPYFPTSEGLPMWFA